MLLGKSVDHGQSEALLSLKDGVGKAGAVVRNLNPQPISLLLLDAKGYIDYTVFVSGIF